MSTMRHSEPQNRAEPSVTPSPTVSHRPYVIDETQFESWEQRWDSKQQVIEHLLSELEKAMTQSEKQKEVGLQIVGE